MSDTPAKESPVTEENAGSAAPQPATGSHGVWTPDGEVPPAAPEGVQEDAVLNALKTVFDPEIPVDIYEMGLIYAVEIGEDGTVKVEMTLTTPSCPSAQELPTMVEEAVRTVPNVSDVEVEVVWDPPWDPSRMSEDARLALNMY
ncbi:putative cytosolic protein [Roseomonas mucosa]|uniref:FeS assembly SUF system protein n=1 Tax=Roseomonas mucosa TaxID=207340 RepID=A0A379N2Z6_9PROT|nr:MULTISPECIES: SUF system Fe-S cluster assembly protein [Roseomonas]MDT8261877.1 SUF system Fe-S cluster assembly protein [Roseomonas sp. DSM 102946]AWV22748.1 putative cytosolic protein [Roseomonas mucosa]MCG7354093.1 SUF system Fe-S cluster assembly protein [Roseomonas mucosa]MCG7359175.1 SUF system Fe-S cluster assembly protein [Roseomonas mucosa]MDT8276224.1 SUF system Fe-S cluster assembly protein [Roseomonas mucosa]